MGYTQHTTLFYNSKVKIGFFSSLNARAATRDDILRLIEAAEDDPRLIAMVLLLKDSGLRVSDLIKLTYADIRKPFEAGEQFIPLQIITKKNGILAKTAIGPEAIQALKTYLDFRRKGTRYLNSEAIKENSPLFRTRSNDIQTLSRSSVSSSISYLVERAGLKGEISAHSLRKYTETRLEAAGVNPNWVDQIIGHRLPGSRSNYSRPEDTDLYQAYQDAYNELRVFEIPASAADLERTASELRKAQQELQSLKTDLSLSLSRNLIMEKNLNEYKNEVDDMKGILKLIYENPELADLFKGKKRSAEPSRKTIY